MLYLFQRLLAWPPILIIISFYIIFITTTKAQKLATTTDEGPQYIATGRLNQFNGFYTPRPLSDNAQFTYASIWASWSAWSFCTQHVQIRVRACNTVRGFSCLGSNKETRPCPEAKYEKPENNAFMKSNVQQKIAERLSKLVNEEHPNNRDYEIADPWAEDRREAFKQLYTDYNAEETRITVNNDNTKSKLKKISKPLIHSAGLSAVSESGKISKNCCSIF